MIRITRKEDCVGCSACVERCPVQCISFERDEQGFRYPGVDSSRCINCSLCERVCPVINAASEREPIEVYGAFNNNQSVVEMSSSGGIFFALAKKMIERGGVVFGARFDKDFNVVHSYAETIEVLKAFQGSKYLQSDIGESFRQVEESLKQGRPVLFTGTPCQIAALRLFLRKDYGDLLLKVDVICHGVPSPLVWKNYVSEKISSNPNIRTISFRDKRAGWKNYGFSYEVDVNGTTEKHFELMRDNIYMQTFLRDLTLRPSCFACPAKGGRSGSDLTLGDFWRVESLEPDIASESGTSLVVIHTQTGNNAFKSINSLVKLKTTYQNALKSNPSLKLSADKPIIYDEFWSKYVEFPTSDTLRRYIKLHRGSFIRRLLRYLKRYSRL